MSYGFCSKFHTLSSSAKISKIGYDFTKVRESLKVGNIFETQSSYIVCYLFIMTLFTINLN